MQALNTCAFFALIVLIALALLSCICVFSATGASLCRWLLKPLPPSIICTKNHNTLPNERHNRKALYLSVDHNSDRGPSYTFLIVKIRTCNEHQHSNGTGS